MTKLQVFDPAMCCSTGVCGPNPDPVLPRFAADLQWLATQGIAVERFNLAQEPQAFAASATGEEGAGRIRQRRPPAHLGEWRHREPRFLSNAKGTRRFCRSLAMS